MNRTEIN